jgi:hypothetical protein
MMWLICWLAVSICRAIHNTKALERAGINAEWKA